MTTQQTSNAARRARADASVASTLAIALVVSVSVPISIGLAQTKAPAQAKPPAQTQAPAQAKPPAPAPTPAPAAAPQALNPVGGQPAGPPITPKPGGPLAPSPTTYKVDAIEFYLPPNQFVEYKFNLKTGQTMVFNWKATGPVDVDFHTVPEGKPISASETFFRGKATSGQGTYRAPYPGLHGWYWLNSGKEGVNIVLNASGFFSQAMMFSGDPVGEPMEVQDPPPPEQ